MKEKELWLRAALSAFQGIINEGFCKGHCDMPSAAASAFDAADAFVEEWKKRMEKKYYCIDDIAE